MTRTAVDFHSIAARHYFAAVKAGNWSRQYRANALSRAAMERSMSRTALAEGKTGAATLMRAQVRRFLADARKWHQTERSVAA